VRLVVVALFGMTAIAPIRAQSVDSEAVRRLSEYIQINTTNPPGNELLAARWLQKQFAAEGIAGQILDTAELGPGRANFYARLPATVPSHRSAIALVSHMDVVPVTRSGWSVDPFAGLVKDGYVWGRGALDMKGHAVIQMMALFALKRSGTPRTRDIVFIGNADEESDGNGAITFVKQHKDLLSGVEFLLTEGADTRVEHGQVKWFAIDVGEKRPYWQKLTVHGTTSHGSVPTPDNPVPRLAKALARIADWQTPVRVLPAVDRFFKAQSRYETGEHRKWLSDATTWIHDPTARAWILSQPERNALLRNTVSITVLNGSNKTNIIPAEASAELDVRLLPDEDTLTFRRELIRIIADPKVELETLGGVEPQFSAPLGTEMFNAIVHVVGEILPGIPIATPIDAGASDRPTYAQAGIICYGLDPWLVDIEENRRGVHGNDERLSLDNVGFGIRFYRRLLSTLQ
jgi:acetylornithine deacetylase/succinyl-diaminopimelate desuccinylase-like protein